MPDRDKEALQTRNKDTLLTVRVPAGLKPRAAQAAKKASVTVSAFVVAAIERELERPDSGNTASAGSGEVVKPRAARQPRPRTAKPPAAKFSGPAPCRHRLPPGAWCKTCGAAKP